MNSLPGRADGVRAIKRLLAPVTPLGAALVLAGLAIHAYLVARVWPFTVDDAFITFRYASNLAAGFGPTYNPGAPPVEGYTGFLWLLLLVLPHAAHLDAVLFAKIAGVLFTVGTMAVCFVWSHRLCRFSSEASRSLAAGSSVLLLGAIPLIAVHAVSGMETALFMLLMTASFFVATRFLEEPSPAGSLSLSALLLALGLTRPEGNVVAAMTAIAALLLCGRQNRLTLASHLVFLYLLPGALYFFWRVRYYDLLLPLPFYIKVANAELFAGRSEVMGFSAAIGTPMAVLMVLGLAHLRRQMIPALAGTAAFLVFFLFPLHIMGYDWRFLAPITPVFCVLAATGVAGLDDILRANAAARRTVWACAAVAVVCAALLGSAKTVIAVRTSYAAGLARAHRALGHDLARVGSELERPVLAMFDAGAAPYYSGWQAVDTGGLNEATIALTRQHDVGYILSQHPDAVVLISTREDEFAAKNWAWWEAALYTECVKRGMKQMGLYAHEPSYFLWVMADPRSPAGRAMAALPLDIRELMQRGLDELYQKRDAARATATFEDVLSRQPTHYGATYQLAAALDTGGRADEATRKWKKVLELARQYDDEAAIARIEARLKQGS